jgi:hypothetical protein
MTMQREALCRNADRILFGQLQRRQDKRGHTMSQVEVNTRINGVDVQRMAETLTLETKSTISHDQRLHAAGKKEAS